MSIKLIGNTENTNSANNTASNVSKQNQFSSIRPYQKLNRNQHIRQQSDLVQFESPPTYTEYSHKTSGISPFMQNNQNFGAQNNDSKSAQQNFNQSVLQDLSNKSSSKIVSFTPQTAPVSPIKPVSQNKGEPKRSIIQFNVTMNKLLEKEVPNDQELSDIHFSLTSNQELDPCASSRMNPDLINTNHNRSAQEVVNDSLYFMNQEMRPPHIKPVIQPQIMEKLPHFNNTNNTSGNLQVDQRDKPFSITCDSHRSMKASPINTRELNDTQLDDVLLLERYSQENRNIKQLDFNNRFQPSLAQTQTINTQVQLSSRPDIRLEQEKKSSLSNISMTAKSNTSQLISDYPTDEIQYKLNFSSRYQPNSKSELESQRSKKLEQNTPKFNRNQMGDSRSGGTNPHSRQANFIQPQDFKTMNNGNQQGDNNIAEEVYTYNNNPSGLFNNNFRSPSPKMAGNNGQLAHGDFYSLQKQQGDENIPLTNRTNRSNRESKMNNQLTLDDLDQMKQYQNETYNQFITNPAQNSGSQKNVIESVRKVNLSPSKIIANNMENKSHFQSQNHTNNTSHFGGGGSRYQQYSDDFLNQQQPPSSILPIPTDAHSVYSANMQRYCDNENMSLMNKQMQKQKEFVNCSPVRTNQNNLQFIHERLARQKEVVLNNANFHLESAGNIKNKSQHLSPSKDSPSKDQSMNNLKANNDTSSSFLKSKKRLSNIESSTTFSPQKQRTAKVSPRDKLPNYLKQPFTQNTRSQTPNPQLKKWKENSVLNGGDSQINNIPHQGNTKQRIQSPQSETKRDILEKLLKKSPSSQVPDNISQPQINTGIFDVNTLLIPLQNNTQEDQAKRSRQSDLVTINETTPNTKIQQILYGRNKETLTPKTNTNQGITPGSKTANNTPRNVNSNLNFIDDISNTSYRSPKNMEQFIQNKQAATALILNDKITKRQPSPFNRNSELSQPSPINKGGLSRDPSPINKVYNNERKQSLTPKNAITKHTTQTQVSQPSPRNPQNTLNKILSPKNTQTTPRQQQPSPLHNKNMSATNFTNEAEFNKIFSEMDDTKIQDKINMIKTQLQSISKQNNQILQQHENITYIQTQLQQQPLGINSYAPGIQTQQNPYDYSKYQTPKQDHSYYSVTGPITNSHNNVTTTTVTTVHTYKKNSPQKSISNTNYSPINSKYSDLELPPTSNYNQAPTHINSTNIADPFKFQSNAITKLPQSQEQTKNEVPTIQFINSRASELSNRDETVKRASQTPKISPRNNYLTPLLKDPSPLNALQRDPSPFNAKYQPVIPPPLNKNSFTPKRSVNEPSSLNYLMGGSPKRDEDIETTKAAAMKAVNIVNQITSPRGYDEVQFDNNKEEDYLPQDHSIGYEYLKGKTQNNQNLFQNFTANNSPANKNGHHQYINPLQDEDEVDELKQNFDSKKPLSDYFVTRKAHLAKKIEDKQEQTREKQKQRSANPSLSKERSKANILEKRKQVQQQYTKQNSQSNIMNITETNSFFFDTNNNSKQPSHMSNNNSTTNRARSISPLNSKKTFNSKNNLNINDGSCLSIYSQKNSPYSLSKTPSNNNLGNVTLIDRLVKGEKVKLSEKEMREQSKRRYQNLPDVKRKKEEQIKNASKLEEYKKRHEKMRQLDEVTNIL